MLRELGTNAFHPQFPIEIVNGQNTLYYKQSQTLKLCNISGYILHGQLANSKHNRRQPDSSRKKYIAKNDAQEIKNFL